MPNLRNNLIDTEIGWCYVGHKKMLYVQVGNVREYYGTFTGDRGRKADKFLKILKEWDEAGGNDG